MNMPRSSSGWIRIQLKLRLNLTFPFPSLESYIHYYLLFSRLSLLFHFLSLYLQTLAFNIYISAGLLSPSFLLLFMSFLPPSPSPALPPRLWPVVSLSVRCSPTLGLRRLSTLLLITPQYLPIYLGEKWNRGGERPEDIMVTHVTTVKA